MNLHISTQKAVIGSKRWIIKAPVQQVVITCIEVPKEKNSTYINKYMHRYKKNHRITQLRIYISSFAFAQGKDWTLHHLFIYLFFNQCTQNSQMLQTSFQLLYFTHKKIWSNKTKAIQNALICVCKTEDLKTNQTTLGASLPEEEKKSFTWVAFDKNPEI